MTPNAKTKVFFETRNGTELAFELVGKKRRPIELGRAKALVASGEAVDGTRAKFVPVEIRFRLPGRDWVTAIALGERELAARLRELRTVKAEILVDGKADAK